MKLDEIIDTNIMAFRANKPVQSKQYTPSEIGNGWYSTVHAIKDPHLVMKKSFGSPLLQGDAYFQYIQYVVDNKLAESNPYFPRVYDIVLVDSKEDSTHAHYIIKMERLLPWQDITAKEMVTVIEKVVNLKEYGAWYTPEFLETAQVDELYAVIVDTVIKATRGDFSFIADEKLTEAIKVIDMIRMSGEQRAPGRHTWDIGKNNMMFRRIPTGLQLVITDPLS